MKLRHSVILAAALLFGVAATAAAVPHLIDFQGILTDGSGTPITTPTSVVYSIWDAAAAGDSLWSESQVVTPDSFGRFSIGLGSVSSIPDSALISDAYLAMKIDTDPETAPRTRLLSTPYSLRTGTVDSASGGTISGNVTVDGDITTENIQITNGAATGYVLSSTDNLGNAAWAPAATGSGNTLDEAYDTGGAGAGRKIYADAGPVQIDGFTGQDALFVRDSMAAGVNNGAMINVFHQGGGPGIGVHHDNAGPAIALIHSGTGEGTIINMANPADAKEGVAVLHTGLGGGGNFVLTNAANTSAAVTGTTAGSGPGVRGVSDLEDGVSGVSNTGGTWATSAKPIDINGGVHGFTPSEEGGVDYFGVVGTGDGYEGTGILGIGNGERGHGIIGVSGVANMPAHTQAAIWGMTRTIGNWTDFKTAHPLTDVSASKKAQVAVLGQTGNGVAVWGESQSYVGVIGTSGGKKGLVDVPDALKSGVYGLGSLNGNYGVYGKADSGWGALGVSLSTEHTDAGVVGVGNGTAANAAAVEVRNGAIRVTGPAKTADVAVISSPVGVWSEVFSSTFACTDCVHAHRTGWLATFTIANPLIDPARSMVFVTMFDAANPLTASISAMAAGSFTVRVMLPRGDVIAAGLPATVTIQYLIINS